jgi:hypothetical protein
LKTICGLVLPVLALGASICVWNYDPLDQFYDPSLGLTVDCSYSLQQNLQNLGHTVTVSTTLPSNLSSYDLVFVTMGFTRSC